MVGVGVAVSTGVSMGVGVGVSGVTVGVVVAVVPVAVVSVAAAVGVDVACGVAGTAQAASINAVVSRASTVRNDRTMRFIKNTLPFCSHLYSVVFGQ